MVGIGNGTGVSVVFASHRVRSDREVSTALSSEVWLRGAQSWGVSNLCKMVSVSVPLREQTHDA